MLPTVEGTYRNGRIELAETPQNVGDATRAPVTFLAAGEVDLRSQGIDERQAQELRRHVWRRLQTTGKAPSG